MRRQRYTCARNTGCKAAVVLFLGTAGASAALAAFAGARVGAGARAALVAVACHGDDYISSSCCSHQYGEPTRCQAIQVQR
ncbi:hypothetical protein F5X97DRAFT_303179 [Nemania serpens]|nr:hypothetical protein F5X97DRAFT_303179 [Nemania serpens]